MWEEGKLDSSEKLCQWVKEEGPTEVWEGVGVLRQVEPGGKRASQIDFCLPVRRDASEKEGYHGY